MPYSHVAAFRRLFAARNWPLACACYTAVLLGALTLVIAPARDTLLRWEGNLIVPVTNRVVALRRTPRQAVATVVLRNLTAEPIRVVGASTTCSCIATKNAFPVTIEPRNQQTVTFDLVVPDHATEGDRLGGAKVFTESESRSPQVVFVLGLGYE